MRYSYRSIGAEAMFRGIKFGIWHLDIRFTHRICAVLLSRWKDTSGGEGGTKPQETL